MGILLALIERGKSGRGQIVDADMVCFFHPQPTTSIHPP
jgi:crotonobetainyl-CoA:carnitine CoA-transferase CaiB-like acyl-CoA transferase